ncbi:MAG: ATP-binding protein [Mariprofundaceae bacterium]
MMEAVSIQSQPHSLAPEWERIEWLAWHALCVRRDQKDDDAETARLHELQAKVASIRYVDGVWAALGIVDLTEIELDILACVVAPEMEPRIGWMYRELQSGSSSPYPSLALLQELLVLDSSWVASLHEAVGKDAALRKHRLIRVEGTGPFAPLQPAEGLSTRLAGGYAEPPPPPGSMLVHQPGDWDDLVLPADRIAMMREFLLWIEQRHVVVGEWGGKHVGGPIALFSGPSGTGKTFASSVLANALGWPLYRVNLGELVSKYIGETEKNLNLLFEAASGRSLVLQFDEADSLFGKRGEVKDARDRYANMGVSHLLACIEAHNGPCILTTNLRKHLDSAFARRFQVVIDFPRPDAADRARLWRRLLPPHAPIEKDIDPLFLGRAVALSGGNICNAALHAAYLAAGEGLAINRGHVALAVWRELTKGGREVARRDMGDLANDLPATMA